MVEVSFSEAFFKVHYTKGFRLSYPIPLPTSVAGIFGALLGIERGRKDWFENFLFGAKIKKYSGYVIENATMLQYKTYRLEKPVALLSLIASPTYLICIAGKERHIKEIESKIKDSIEFLPYGGQNDFFANDWSLAGIDMVEESDELTNYAPQDWVDLQIGGDLNIRLHILPVMHTLSENPNFYFVTEGKLKLKRKVPCTKTHKIGLYNLNNFKPQFY